MYESPITVMYEKIAREIIQEQDAYVFSEIKKCGVKVNKNELIKALAYDREQYKKGYQDGYKQGHEDAEQKILEAIKCSTCKYKDAQFSVCGGCENYSEYEEEHKNDGTNRPKLD